MKPAPFEYHRPRSVEEAIACLARLEDAKLLAGGQSLMPMMNFRYLAPANIIDLNRIPELSGIALDDNRLRIGAMTRQRALLDSPLVRGHAPLLADALVHVGHPPTRNRGTIGGSVSHLDPAAELPAALSALDATLHVNGANGPRELSIHDWSAGYMTPAIEPDELLCELSIPVWPAGHGHAFEEVARRRGDFALAGAAALLSLDAQGSVARVSIALTGVDTAPVRLSAAEAALSGQIATAEAFAAVARHALEVPGLDDVHASAAYRRKVAATMTRRALEAALLSITEGNKG